MPTIRITQEPVRTLVLPTDAKLRVTQEPVRVLVLPTDAKLRVTQLAVRVLRLSNPPPVGNLLRGVPNFGLSRSQVSMTRKA